MGRADGAAPALVPATDLAEPEADVDAAITVEVVCALAPHQLLRTVVRLPAGATVLQALRASGLTPQLPPGLLDQLALGVWGRACDADTRLQPNDRVELTRALTVDPKEARRLRYRRDGVRRQPPRRRDSGP